MKNILLISIMITALFSCKKNDPKPITQPVVCNKPICNPVQDSIYIGKLYQGGKIFYIDSTGKHGLIAATEDCESMSGAGWAWCSGSFVKTDAIETAIGTGKSNTSKILNSQYGSNYAAGCTKTNWNNYTDWFLPSKDELLKLQSQQLIIGGFANDLYWSSTEINLSTAFCTAFGNGSASVGGGGKNYKHSVRAIRAF